MAEKIENGVHEATAAEKYVAPTEKEVLEHLEWFKDQKLGLWLKLNGEGIYGTRPIFPYEKAGVSYTAKNGAMYAFIKYNRDYKAVRAVELHSDKKVKEITLLRNGQAIPFTQNGNTVLAYPKDAELYNLKYADCLKITY